MEDNGTSASRKAMGFGRLVKTMRPLKQAEVVRILRRAILRRDEGYMRRHRDPRLRVSLPAVRWLKPRSDDDV